MTTYNMVTYKTYQEAKIANPKEGIYTSMSGDFTPMGHIAYIALSGCKQWWNGCDPADYCMTVEEFLSEGYRFVDGDLILEEDIIIRISDCIKQNEGYETESANEPDCYDYRRYILRAAVLENIPTETPEEKEALDGIESVGCGEWENGDECIYNGKEWQFVSILSEEFHGTAVIFDRISEELKQVDLSNISKPETPQQREERILEELADEACENLFGDSIKNCRPVVAETVRWMINYGYRKQG